LDHLVFELARKDAGIEQRGTQFPIMDAKNDFDGRGTRGWLKGINASHIAALERYQPYAGCNWTARLRDFTNADKHRHFVVTGGESAIHIHSSLDTDLSRIIEPSFKRKAIHPVTGGEVDMKVYISGTVTFDDGSPILETIQEIKRGVRDCLVAFNSEF
jgi:hypothetical protein